MRDIRVFRNLRKQKWTCKRTSPWGWKDKTETNIDCFCRPVHVVVLIRLPCSHRNDFWFIEIVPKKPLMSLNISTPPPLHHSLQLAIKRRFIKKWMWQIYGPNTVRHCATAKKGERFTVIRWQTNLVKLTQCCHVQLLLFCDAQIWNVWQGFKCLVNVQLVCDSKSRLIWGSLLAATSCSCLWSEFSRNEIFFIKKSMMYRW